MSTVTEEKKSVTEWLHERELEKLKTKLMLQETRYKEELERMRKMTIRIAKAWSLDDTDKYIQKENAKYDQLNKDFTEEERKMFDEYYSLEEKYLMLVWPGSSSPDQEIKETYQKISAHVENMLLIPGSVERCQEYLERKLRRQRHLDDDKVYTSCIDVFVEDVQRNRQKKEEQ